MLRFLDDQAAEVFHTWFTHSPDLLTISGPSGELIAVNESFEKWSGYTSHELIQLGVRRLSVNDSDLEADEQAMQECIEGKRTSYSVRKQLVPKGEKPQQGELAVVRFPLTGDLKWFLSSWTPLQNGNAAAFSVAIEHITKATEMISAQHEAIKLLDKRLAARDKIGDGERLWLLIGKLGVKRPRLAMAIVVAVLSSILSANALSILKDWIGIQSTFNQYEQQFEPVSPMDVQPAEQIAQMKSFDRAAPMTVSLSTPAGNTIELKDGTYGLRKRIAEFGCSTSDVGLVDGSVRRFGTDDRGSYWSGDWSRDGTAHLPAKPGRWYDGPVWRRSDEGSQGGIF